MPIHRCARVAGYWACGLALLMPAVTTAQSVPANALTGTNSPQSLGDYARNLRQTHRSTARLTEGEQIEILKRIDDLLVFASDHTGLPIRGKVERRFISQNEVVSHAHAVSENSDSQRTARMLTTLMKFGFVPRGYDLGNAAQAYGESVAAYYDPRTKRISLLNWVPIEEQMPIIAHELTHALQDQNFDLQKWMGDVRGLQVSPEEDAGEAAASRRAVAEGQAMVVYMDYTLKAYGRSLEDSPELYDVFSERVQMGMPESPALHAAPLVVKEGMLFPYREGVAFEVAMLRNGGKKAAFEDTMKRPPRNTHEILHPEAYLANETTHVVPMPALPNKVAAEFELFDGGTFGELDTRVFIQQFGTKKLAGELASGWRGGAYFTLRPKLVAARGKTPSASELGLFYMSQWDTPERARTFASFYAGAVSQRYPGSTKLSAAADAKNAGALWSQEFATADGIVTVELWPNNVVVAFEGVADSAAKELRVELAKPHPSAVAQFDATDLTLRAASAPELATVRDAISATFLNALGQSAECARARSATPTRSFLAAWKSRRTPLD
jgi:hypothetical protein